MKTHAERKAETERLTAMLPDVREELTRIPGVSRVTVGIRERGGQLTEDIVFRVHVDEKLPESALPPEQVLPKSTRGVPIDVIVKRLPKLETGFGDENHANKYSTLVGGISVSAEDAVPEIGATLGCFCRRTTDDKIVLLSNWHVLIKPDGAIGKGAGHPLWRKSCCCVCDRIGAILDFDQALDCAIAELDKGVKFAPKVRRITRLDGTLEEGGRIAGDGTPIPGDEVYKVGIRTGLTRGMITDVDPTRAEVSPTAAFARMSDKGDSGSVYISSLTGDVVILHNAGDGTRGFGTPFPAVKARLNIEVIPSDPTIDYQVVDTLVVEPMVEPPFTELVAQLETTPAGQALLQLLQAHRDQVLDLVNHRRRFTVAWQRYQGPAYLAALARSARDPLYRIPRSIDGITRRDAARHLEQALRATASAELVADLDAFGPALALAFLEGDTVTDLLRRWEDARLPALR